MGIGVLMPVLQVGVMGVPMSWWRMSMRISMEFANRIVQAVAVLMGPNAHHVDPFILNAESGSLVVTSDIIVLFAREILRIPWGRHQR